VIDPAPQQPGRRVRRRTPATTSIAGAILIGFGIQIAKGATNDAVRLAELGAIWAPAIFVGHEYWRLLTAMFLHGGVLHLVMNLFALVQIGSMFELMFGTRRFLTIYFVSGLLASLTSAFFTEGPSVGASGAIFGILGAFVLSVKRSPRWRHERFARNIVKQLLFWIVANIIIGFQIPQIDNSAHLGGLLAGVILGAILPHRAPPPPPPAQMVIDVRPHDSGST
jgi:rhomboid protease GluP